jgi:hypothetical protein
MTNRASEIKVITIKVHSLTTTQVSYSMNQDKSNTVHRPFVARDPKSKELITNFRAGKRYAIQQRVGAKGTEWVKAVEIDACDNQISDSNFQPLVREPYFHDDVTQFSE